MKKEDTLESSQELTKQTRMRKEIFMKESTKSKNAFLWPSPKDEIWLNFGDILWIIEEPIPFGKSKRVFKLNEEATLIMNNEEF
jgi:hypothetical protein